MTAITAEPGESVAKLFIGFFKVIGYLLDLIASKNLATSIVGGVLLVAVIVATVWILKGLMRMGARALREGDSGRARKARRGRRRKDRSAPATRSAPSEGALGEERAEAPRAREEGAREGEVTPAPRRVPGARAPSAAPDRPLDEGPDDEAPASEASAKRGAR